MRAAIVSYGLREGNVRLQPWRYVTEIARGLQRKNIDVTIITDGPDGRRTIEGVEVVFVGRLRSLPLVRNRRLIDLVAGLKPDVLLWSVGPLDYLYMSTFKELGTPLIGMFNGPIYSAGDLARMGVRELVGNYRSVYVHLLHASLPKFFLRSMVNDLRFSQVFVMSRKNRDVLEKLGVRSSKIVHVPVGIDDYDLAGPVELDSIAQRYGLKQGSFHILYLGSPNTIRGIDVQIEALSRIAAAAPEARLIVLSRRRGDELSREEQAVRELIESRGVADRVHLVSGFLDREEIKRFIAFSDVISLPFKMVPADVPTSILEAMALGKPVISTSIDGIPELLTEGRGFVVRPNDPGDLGEAILSCYSNRPSLSASGLRARQYMQQYPRWEQVSDQVVGLLQAVAAGDAEGLKDA